MAHKIILIAAVAENNCIGRDGELPWRLPEDMKRFKELTTGKVVVMGRKTWESIPAKFRPLPDRVNVVLSQNPDYVVPDGVRLRHSVVTAIAEHLPESDVYVIGGGEIYDAVIGVADVLEITRVHEVTEGDTFFPKIHPGKWECVYAFNVSPVRKTSPAFRFETYHRRM